jgi:diguanylate cyclase (GGDEF)-like protein
MARQRKVEKLSRIRDVSAEMNAAIVRVQDREALLRESCRIVVEHGGFEFVWTGLVDEERRVVQPVAWSGFSDRTAAAVGEQIDNPRVMLNEVLRTRRPAVRNDVEADGRNDGAGSGFLRREANAKGCGSSICLPFFVDDRIVATLVIYAVGHGFFDRDELALLTELTADVSFALQSLARQEQLHYLSYYDPLTGLPNGQLFLDRVSQHMRALEGDRRMLALCLFEVERFRALNETLGRDGGDVLLKEIAARSEATFGTKDVLARVAGATFGIMATGIRDAAEAAGIVEQQLAGCFSRPFAVNGNELRVAARAGVALYPVDGADAGALYSHAEAALKRAVSAGERYLFYAPEMNAQVAQSILLETKLRAAVDAEQFVLHYQPQIDLSSGAVCGLEALIRWQDPEKGLIPPGAFIPLLEETGLILQAGRWALAQAMKDHRDWRARGINVTRIAVNVSAIQLQQKDFVETVLRTVREAGNDPSALEVEVTESLLMHDMESSIQKLSALRDVGVNVAMDDFGTGYSSLSNISRLPIDLLKVDRSFVDGMAQNAQYLAIVRTILALADALSLRVIAEGVETREQAQLLKLLRCHEAQGYYYSKPLPKEALEAYLAGQAEAAAT